MENEESVKQKSSISGFVSTSRDVVSLLRDTSIFLVFVLLFANPTWIKSRLALIGFEKANIMGLELQTGLISSDSALKEAHVNITDLQKSNNEIIKTLVEVRAKLTDLPLKEQIAKLEQENIQLKVATEQVQTKVSRTISSNAPLVASALSVSNQSTIHHTSDYLVGIQTLGMADDARKSLNETLLKIGYSLHDISSSYQVGERPEWFAQKNTVFYYSKSALLEAQNLAQAMKNLTGKDFTVQRGSGLGVDPSQREVTLFVHYIRS